MGKRDQWGWGRCLKKKPSQILMISTDQNKHRSKFHNETYYLIHKLKIDFSKQLSVLATFLWFRHVGCGGDRIR